MVRGRGQGPAGIVLALDFFFAMYCSKQGSESVLECDPFLLPEKLSLILRTPTNDLPQLPNGKPRFGKLLQALWSAARPHLPTV